MAGARAAHWQTPVQTGRKNADLSVGPIEFPILNAARAFAALWVMVAHVTLIGAKPVFLLSQGFLAVECFIFISGFLMMLLLARERSLNLSSALRFYTRRCLPDRSFVLLRACALCDFPRILHRKSNPVRRGFRVGFRDPRARRRGRVAFGSLERALCPRALAG